MTSLYLCNPHNTSRSPGSESVEASGLKMLLTPLTDTQTRDCRAQILYQSAAIILSVCLSACLQAAFPNASPYLAEVSWQEM